MKKKLKIVLATRNRGKIKEIGEMLADLPLEVCSLLDFPDCPEAVESYDTYVENARQKARAAAEFCSLPALADDSGLEVEALGGAPGVKSARWAGEKVGYEANNQKMLSALKEVTPEKRGAAFRCCMVLRSPKGEEWVTKGLLRGWITEQPVGKNGFGYDPIFRMENRETTLAQLSLEDKNKISHRTEALRKMKPFLEALAKQACS